MATPKSWLIIDGKIPEASLNIIKNQAGRYRLYFEKIEKKRSIKQNAALHLWFQQLADTLNQDGFDMRAVIKPEIDIMWTDYCVKEYLWRPVQIALCGKKSTTRLNTEMINKIYDVINKAIGERVDIHVPFPCIDNM